MGGLNETYVREFANNRKCWLCENEDMKLERLLKEVY